MPVTWNPADKNAGISLSGSNLLATSSAGSGTVNQAVRASSSISLTIKQYFEVTIGGTAGQYFSIGVLSGTALLTDNIGLTGAGFVRGLAGSGQNSTDYVNNVIGSVTPSNPAVGTVIGVAVDRAANKIWWERSSGVWFDGTGGGGDPGTNSGGRSIAVVTGTLYPAFSSAWTGDIATLTAVAPFTYAIPSGFVALDPGGGGGGATQARAMVLA